MIRSTLFLLLIAGLRAQAQAPDTLPAPVCWKAKPAAGCRSFIVTTIALEHPVVATRRVQHHTWMSEASSLFPGTRLTGTVGWMLNRGSRAYGAAAVFSQGGEHARSGVDLRVRQWLHGGEILELGVGALEVTGDATPFRRMTGGGLSASAEYGQPNFLALVTRYELVRAEGKLHQGGYVGARVGSFGAPIVVGVGLALIYVVLAPAYGGT